MKTTIVEIADGIRRLLASGKEVSPELLNETMNSMEVMMTALTRQDESIKLLVTTVHESWKLLNTGDESKETHDRVYEILSDGMVKFQDLIENIRVENARGGSMVKDEQSNDERVKEAEDKLREEMRENSKLMLENQALKREIESRAIQGE